MSKLPSVVFPNEDKAYRNARNTILRAEKKLRAQIEHVASLRQQLPRGGKLEKEYIVEVNVKLSVKPK